MDGRPGRVAMFEQLRADGVKYIFGNPGSSEENIVYSLEMFPEIKYILCLQETVAVAAADGMARVEKKPAFVQLHTGVGLGNGIGMLYQAYRGHSPLVVFAGEAGVRYEAMDGQMAAELVEMARPVTKYATKVNDPGSVLRIVRRAYKMAATPPTGPVFVALPMDVLDAPNIERVVKTQIPSTRVAPEKEAIDEAAAVLCAARRPIMITGDGIATAGAQRPLARLAELLGAGVWGANSSEVNLPASHPMYGGLTGHMFGADSAQITQGADAVLICGTYTFPEVFPWLENVFDRDAKVIHIDLDSYEIAKNHPVDISFVSDPLLTLDRLADSVESGFSHEQREAAARRRSELEEANRARNEEAMRGDRERRDSVPMVMSRFAEELAGQVDPKDLIFFDEALTHSPELCRYLKPDIPGQFFQTRGGSLGVALPGVLGIKLARPEKMVIGFSGDGGAMYVPQALWTAVRYKIGAKFVICNNKSYRLLKLNLQQYWRDQGIAEDDFPPSFDLCNPDLRFDKLAESFGVPSVRVEEPRAIAEAIGQMLSTDGPFLIDLVLSGDLPGEHHGSCKCGQ
jgi:thiamine pyrophosphate-dependent acetolactate synthase large subunit-like protein